MAKTPENRSQGAWQTLTVEQVWPSADATGATALVFRFLERGTIQLDGEPVAFRLPREGVPILIRLLSQLAASMDAQPTKQ